METYVLYLYYWEDGHFYIGRTKDNDKRFDNPNKYSSQFVYKFMQEPHTAVKLYTSGNYPLIAWLEGELITYFYQDWKCCNVAIQSGIADACDIIKKYTDLNAVIQEFNIIAICGQDILETLIKEIKEKIYDKN